MLSCVYKEKMETSNNPGLEDTHAPACSPAGKATKSHARSAKLKATLRAAAIVLPQQLLHTGMVRLGITPFGAYCGIKIVLCQCGRV